MANTMETNHLSWFHKAEEDELSTKNLLKEGGSFSTICFLCQQMAEKYLKGLLIFFNKSFPKIHDLLEIETLILKDYPEIKDLHEDFKVLNRYYTETRYPGDYPEFTLKEAKEAFESAVKIKNWVLEKTESV